MDHGKRDVSAFPIATGTYYKVDYSRGVDISRYKNLPVPTSYMAAKSDYDFVGGYDEGAGAGLLHVADHHIAPGKKQWTWGCGDFGKAWDRNLTDEDGPYVELMTGCFTDNQPDFSFIAPMERKDFTQYFMPYHDIGTVHNACRDLALCLEVGDEITVRLYCSGSLGRCGVEINGREVQTLELTCANTYEVRCPNEEGLRFEKVAVRVAKDGRTVLLFDGNVKKQPVPEPAKPAPLPADCASCEDLYLYGLHIEQYRHATRRAEDYYREGLRRAPDDLRLNHAYGMLLFKKGAFRQALPYLQRAVEKQTRSNPNPAGGEPYYDLALCLFYLEEYDAAYDAFYKAAWNAETKSNAQLFLARILARQGRFEDALSFADASLAGNARNMIALNLRTMLLRALGRDWHASAEAALSLDPLDSGARYLAGVGLSEYMRQPNCLIDLSLEFARAGFYGQAEELLSLAKGAHPMTGYYQAYYAHRAGRDCTQQLAEGAAADPYCCFPNRIEDIAVLEFAAENAPRDAKAPYYLGCLFYDKERHADAIRCFEESVRRGCDFATPYRNLALLCYNVKGAPKEALACMNTAYRMDETDARVLYELDLLKKRTGVLPRERLAFLQKRLAVVSGRDDLYLEYISLLNLIGQHDEARQRLMTRQFHPWEGGEGKVPEQYLFACIAGAIKTGEPCDFLAAYTYPENLGEGKLYGAQENRQNYYLGCALAKRGDADAARECFLKASSGISVPASAVYYNDQPPETIFYQGMALRALGDEKGAADRFDRLIRYAQEHENDAVTIDYFAVSLPDLLVFEEDLNKKNRLHCLFMKALGLYGLGRKEESRALFEELLRQDPNAFSAATHAWLLFGEESQ